MPQGLIGSVQYVIVFFQYQIWRTLTLSSMKLPVSRVSDVLVANYQYRCPSCKAVYTLEASIHTDLPERRPCPRCNFNGSSRDYSFNLQPSFQEHFNHSIGQYVSSNRQFRDSLKVQSDEMSLRMGQNVDLQPLSPSEMAEGSAHGVTEEGLYESRRAMHDSL